MTDQMMSTTEAMDNRVAFDEAERKRRRALTNDERVLEDTGKTPQEWKQHHWNNLPPVVRRLIRTWLVRSAVRRRPASEKALRRNLRKMLFRCPHEYMEEMQGWLMSCDVGPENLTSAYMNCTGVKGWSKFYWDWC